MSISRMIFLLFVLGVSMTTSLFVYAETEKIDINTADAWTLDTLYGVGPAKAAAIVEYREQNGQFKSVNELTQVYGINQNLVDRNRDRIVVSDSVIPESIQSPRPQPVVNINTADAATLAKHLHGIGPKKAAAIVDFRDKNGPFKSIIDLARVTGIGRTIVKRNRHKIVLSDPEVETDPALVPPSTTDDVSSGTDETAPETASISPTTDKN